GIFLRGFDVLISLDLVHVDVVQRTAFDFETAIIRLRLARERFLFALGLPAVEVLAIEDKGESRLELELATGCHANGAEKDGAEKTDYYSKSSHGNTSW